MNKIDELASRESDIKPSDKTYPLGPIGIATLRGSEELAKKIDSYITEWRKERSLQETRSLRFLGYEKDSYVVNVHYSRFGTGEGRGILETQTMGLDLFIIADVTNSSVGYKVKGKPNNYSPDDHFQDLKRLIGATQGKARRITVIMPFLYEGRQFTRRLQESLDCAQMLKELTHMGVTNIITFDANDPRVMNAIPLDGFDNFTPVYQYIKALCRNYDDLKLDNEHLMTISPDVNGMPRAIYLSNILGVDMGMFYKRISYGENGKEESSVIEFLGTDPEGKDVIVLDDMISSGETVLSSAYELKKRGARRVFICSTFGLFTNGFERFDKAFEDGIIEQVFTTNLIYQEREMLYRKWYTSVDMSKFLALLIDYLNHDVSISSLLDPIDRINRVLDAYRNR